MARSLGNPSKSVNVCGDNANVSQTYNGWIDLFCWGTSGWNSGANEYQPWSTSNNNEDFIIGGDGTNELTGIYANADWGVFNKITNGGNKAGMWRTLTLEEWEFLKGSNAIRRNKSGLATIQGYYKGLVLLPDEWTLPNGLTFVSELDDGFAANTYDLNQWQRMEAAGAVFLPVTGCRKITNVDMSEGHGRYWLSTQNNGDKAYFIDFQDGAISRNYRGRYWGQAVRLVRDSRESRGEAFDEDGTSYRRFSVSATSTVRFSKGNLQYNAAQNIWRFAGKQYMYLGDGNTDIAQDYNGWIDLFCWGTSGWNSGANQYQPWSTTTYGTDYQPGGNGTNNLTGDYAYADWGYYNRINNGGNKANQWRTLTRDEWRYLINETENATRSGKYGMATIRTASKSYNGMVILPDDWVLPGGATFTAGYAGGFNTNIYTTAQWQKMEAAGAIFLPAAGGRDGTAVYAVGTEGYYWSSSCNGEEYAVNMGFEGDYMDMRDSHRSLGFSVRLVKD